SRSTTASVNPLPCRPPAIASPATPPPRQTTSNSFTWCSLRETPARRVRRIARAARHVYQTLVLPGPASARRYLRLMDPTAQVCFHVAHDERTTTERDRGHAGVSHRRWPVDSVRRKRTAQRRRAPAQPVARERVRLRGDLVATGRNDAPGCH